LATTSHFEELGPGKEKDAKTEKNENLLLGLGKAERVSLARNKALQGAWWGILLLGVVTHQAKI